MTTTDDKPPEGFTILYPDEPFEMHAGPHYIRVNDDRVVGGFRAKPHHANSNGVVHGGALATMADSILPVFALRQIDTAQTWTATISLNCEFVSPTQVGDWVECHGELTRLTRSLAFIRGSLMVDGRVVMTCSTVLKLTRRTT